MAIPLPGMLVIAASDFGPIVCGQPGIITARQGSTWLRWRTTYSCIFLGGIGVTARRSQLVLHDHGFSRQMLEDPLWFLHTRHIAVTAAGLLAPLRGASR